MNEMVQDMKVPFVKTDDWLMEALMSDKLLYQSHTSIRSSAWIDCTATVDAKATVTVLLDEVT